MSGGKGSMLKKVILLFSTVMIFSFFIEYPYLSKSKQANPINTPLPTGKNTMVMERVVIILCCSR